jgi:predicted acyl esterase
MNPVPSYGGNVCCTGNAVSGGAFDQRKMEERPDILVYTSEPLKEGDRGERPDRRDALRVVRRKDTDFTVKLIDVATPMARPTTWTRPSSACAIAKATTSRRCGWRRARFIRSRSSR